MKSRTRTLLTAAALAASLPLAAQPPATRQTAEAVPYRSAFQDYRAFEAGDVQDWRKSNDTVRAIGGWRVYAREIAGSSDGAAPAKSGQPTTEQAAPVDPHQGHHK